MKKELFMQYQNYYGSMNVDPENNILYGKVEFIRASITYEAKDAVGLKKAFEEAVNEYLDFCEMKKITPEQPFKGSLNIRIGEERHKKAWIKAQAKNQSINEYICAALDASFKDMKVAAALPKKIASKKLVFSPGKKAKAGKRAKRKAD